jgi:hypothetical protein
MHANKRQAIGSFGMPGEFFKKSQTLAGHPGNEDRHTRTQLVERRG